MKQVVLRAGSPEVVDAPAPSPEPGRVPVANVASVISSGTERASLEGGGGARPLPIRALRNPQLITAGLRHPRDHGMRPAIEVARGFASASDSPLGYSCAGLVLDTGGIPAFRVGQLAACAGAGSANHAEVVSVLGNLVAPAPEGLDLARRRSR